MNRLLRTTAILSVFLLAGSRVPASSRQVVIAGNIGDSMCGLRHGRSAKSAAEERECTLQCVSDGSKFILADRINRKVYELEDQTSPRRFAGRKVRVTGEIEGKSLRVESIEETP
jgi:uncharacterized protein DUF5818